MHEGNLYRNIQTNTAIIQTPMKMKKNVPGDTITRSMSELWKDTGNVYKTVMVITKRANQISQDMKNDIHNKLQEVASYTDNLDEIFENKEQIEISKHYEKMPKPVLIATTEFEDGEVYYRSPMENLNK